MKNTLYLKEILDNCKTVFVINHKGYTQFTRIIADYLFEYSLPKEPVTTLYLFAIKSNSVHRENLCIGCSFFKKPDIDFQKGAAQTKLLLKEKINNTETASEQILEIYRHPSYRTSK